MFHRISIADYKQPLIIDAWHIGKIETEPFTHIMGFDESEEGAEKDSEDVYEKPSVSTIHMNAVIGLETGNKVIWIKPYKKARFAWQSVHINNLIMIFCLFRESAVVIKSFQNLLIM